MRSAVHTGIDMNCGFALLALRTAERSPFLDLLERTENGAQIVFDVSGAGAGKQTVQHIDRRIGINRANADRLAHMRHEERAATGARQSRHGLFDAGAVGIRLDDGGGFRTARVVA
jgi:hypothetical protein